MGELRYISGQFDSRDDGAVVGGVGLYDDVCEFFIFTDDVAAFDGHIWSNEDKVNTVVAIFWVVRFCGGRPGPAGVGDFVGERAAKGIAHACAGHGEGGGELDSERALAGIGGALRPVLVRGFVEIAGEENRFPRRERGLQF